MAANTLHITAANDGDILSLHGDMDVSFNEAVSESFSVRLITSSTELFRLSTRFRFLDMQGNLVTGMIFGAVPGMNIELMFNPEDGVWMITDNNFVQTGGLDTMEKEVVFLPLPNMTPINYVRGRNYRGTLTGDAKLKNPENMKPGDRLRIVLVQDTVGARKLTYDGAYGWQGALPPALSTAPQVVDVFEAYMTGDYTLQCNLYLNYSVVRPLAYTDEFHYTMDAAYKKARDMPVNGQTVQVIRDGNRLEVNGSPGYQAVNPLDMRIRGNKKVNGEYPTLRMERGDRPTFGKAIINVEGGRNIVIENLKLSSATVAEDGNACGVMINAKADYVRMENLHILDCENGIRSGVSKHPRFDVINTLIEKCGFSTKAGHAGQTHGIYAGDTEIWRATRTTWRDQLDGHNIKTRALATVLNQVYSRNSQGSREVDCPDQGIFHATDSVFWKQSNGTQNNLIGIGHECLGGLLRYQEYFFINCYFHNDVNPTRDVTFLENKAKTNLNKVAVHFIDCLWGGRALEKENYREALFQGPYTITRTGGPLGPRVPVGCDKALFNPGEIPANASHNPLGIEETPFDALPPMTITEPTPPYPYFVDVRPVPPLPEMGAGGPGTAPDTKPPVVSLLADVEEVTEAGGVLFTVEASDSSGIAKVQYFRNGAQFDEDVAPPYTFTIDFSHLDNGTHKFTAKAFDTAGNTATSSEAVIAVNIVPPAVQPTTRLDAMTQAEYDAAINGAQMGSKRQAGVSALIAAMGENARFIIFRDGVNVHETVYTGNAFTGTDGYDIWLRRPIEAASVTTLSAVDFASGDYWFEYQGGANYTRVISGSIGLAGANVDIEVAEPLAVNQGLQQAFRFVIPRTLDSLS